MPLDSGDRSRRLNGDITLMLAARLADQFGEIPQVSIKAYTDRALQVTEFYLKGMAAKKR